MENKCPFCGSELPEEATFCLACFTTLKPPADTSEKKESPLFLFLKKHGKKLCTGAAALFAFLLIMGICISAMKHLNSAPKPLKSDTTIIVEETYYVPVTEENGVAVTNESGEQVTDVVEVTKIETLPPSTTEEQGFFDKIFNSDSKKDNVSDDKKTDTTTEKKGFFDQLIDSVSGDNEKESSTAPITQSAPTEAHGTTENTTITISTTLPASTEKPSQPTTSAPATTESSTAVLTTGSGSYSFEYTAQYASKPDGNIKLTKYIGNASVVTIPSFIDGRKVAAIATDCFIGDSKIKEIRFDDSNTSAVISLYPHCFNNLSSLNKIVTNNKSVDFNGRTVYKCPVTYVGKDGTTNNKLIDGAYYKGTSFLWFTPHPSYTTLTFPDWCKKIDNSNNLYEVSNLKILNIHKGVLNIPTTPLGYGNGLAEINVEKGHPEVFSHEGVLFYKTTQSAKTYSCFYPYCKTDKVFKLPENCYLSISTSNSVTANPYLEELWLPATSYLESPDYKYFYNTSYPNLEKIYIAKNHPQYDKITKAFTGQLIITDF